MPEKVRINLSKTRLRPDTWIKPSEVFDLYTQDEVWIDAFKEVHRIADMDTRYLRNLRRFLDRGTMKSHLDQASWGLFSRFNNTFVSMLNGEREHDQMQDEIHIWMYKPFRCPLYRSIVGEIARRSHS